MDTPTEPVWGQQWRSSSWFIVTAMCAAFFTDTFLASFIVPILPYMLEGRVGLDPSHTQSMTSWLLAVHAAMSVIIRMPLAHFADKSTSKRSWFLWGLGMSFASTAATAFGTSMTMLFISRAVLALASSVMWVVGFTTVANVVSLENTGKSYAAVSMAAALGASGGPMVAGILFQLAGYWFAWASTFVLLLIDTTFRLLIIEQNPQKADTTSDDSVAKHDSVSETSPLLSGLRAQLEDSPVPEAEPNFYRCIFGKSNFNAGLFCSFVSGFLSATFNATVPLHARDTFNWGGAQSGLIFAALQAPRLVMSPFVGWLKDRVGTCTPTAFGFATLAPFIWMLGLPGSDQFPSINLENNGPAIYIAAMTCIGFQLTYLNGAGTIEATVAISAIQQENPGSFGPNGGKSRAIAISGIAYTLGLCVGPVVGGYLNDAVGYYYMNCFVAGLCIIAVGVSYLYLPSRLSSIRQ